MSKTGAWTRNRKRSGRQDKKKLIKEKPTNHLKKIKTKIKKPKKGKRSQIQRRSLDQKKILK